MAVEYCCDNCHAKSVTLEGWTLVSIAFLHMDLTLPTPPPPRVRESTADDLFFDKAECCAAWCEKAGIVRPQPEFKAIPPVAIPGSV